MRCVFCLAAFTMPYYLDCVTYYSPAASAWQMLYAFITGLIISQGIVYMNSKAQEELFEVENTPLELQTRLDEAEQKIVKLQEQRDRAFKCVIAMLCASWLAFVYFAVNSPPQVGLGANVKTEL
jgi:hypothetical protein